MPQALQYPKLVSRPKSSSAQKAERGQSLPFFSLPSTPSPAPTPPLHPPTTLAASQEVAQCCWSYCQASNACTTMRL